MRWPWPPLRPSEIALAALLIIFGIGLLVALVEFPSLGARFPNRGFGTDWDCAPVPKGEPICVKRTGK